MFILQPFTPCQTQSTSRFMFPSASVSQTAARGRALTLWEWVSVVGLTNASKLGSDTHKEDVGAVNHLFILNSSKTGSYFQITIYSTLFEKLRE